MKISNQQLINELKNITKKVIKDTKLLSTLPANQLNTKANTKVWSAIECIAHLNSYSDYYIPEIKRVLLLGANKKPDVFKSGMLGNYFSKAMKVKPKLNKMTTFKKMDPIYSNPDITVIETFLKYQNETLKILEQARNIDLVKLRTGITISKVLKLRLGDTLRVVIYHNERHIEQAKRAAKQG